MQTNYTSVAIKNHHCCWSCAHLTKKRITAHTSVKEQICEQASYTLHHIIRAKLFTENSAMARLRDILRGWGLAVPLPTPYQIGLLQ